MYIKTAIILTIWLCSSVSHGQSNTVLLKNGNVLRGTVQRDRNRFQIQTSSNRIVLDDSQVAYVCDSMDEAFQLTQAESNPDSVESQVTVFQWCMRHKLHSQAQQQIQTLQLMPIKRQRLEHLNRLVNVAIDREIRLQQTANQQQAPRIKPDSRGSEEQQAEIAQVGYDKPIQIQPLPSSESNEVELSSDRPHVASLKEIADFSKSFPGPSVAYFKRTIEPQMIRNCFNAGCHNANQSSLSLISLHDKSTTKTIRQRNFYNIMKYVDLHAPLESPLFQMATTPHAGMTKAVYTEDRGQTTTLRNWLLSIATPEAQRAYQLKAWEVAQQQLEAKQAPDTRSETRDMTTLPGEIRQTSASLPDSSVPSVPNLNPQQRVFAPKDPFDPEIFNRKYRKR
jgi:hypothetical protein